MKLNYIREIENLHEGNQFEFLYNFFISVYQYLICEVVSITDIFFIGIWKRGIRMEIQIGVQPCRAELTLYTLQETHPRLRAFKSLAHRHIVQYTRATNYSDQRIFISTVIQLRKENWSSIIDFGAKSIQIVEVEGIFIRIRNLEHQRRLAVEFLLRIFRPYLNFRPIYVVSPYIAGKWVDSIGLLVKNNIFNW